MDIYGIVEQLRLKCSKLESELNVLTPNQEQFNQIFFLIDKDFNRVTDKIFKTYEEVYEARRLYNKQNNNPIANFIYIESLPIPEGCDANEFIAMHLDFVAGHQKPKTEKSVKLEAALKDNNVSSVFSINQYFVDYFNLYMIIESGRVDAYHYDRYKQTKLQFETVSNILAGHAPTMADHFHNLEVLQNFAKRVMGIVHHAVYHPQLNKTTTDFFRQWVINLTDGEFERYFGAHVHYNEKEFTLSSPIVKCYTNKISQCYWRCFTNINNTLTWREK